MARADVQCLNLRNDSHGVSTGSGSDRVASYSENRDCEDRYPVATAPGTDLILKLRHYPLMP